MDCFVIAFTCGWQCLEQCVTELSRVLAPTLGSQCTLVLPKLMSLRENMYKLDLEVMTPASQYWDTPGLVFAIEVQ